MPLTVIQIAFLASELLCLGKGDFMNTTSAEWNTIKRKFMHNWTTLNEEEIERTHGNKAALTTLLQHKYSIPHEQAVAAVSEIMPENEKPDLPETETPKTPSDIPKNEPDKQPVYPNKIYEEKLPPQLDLNPEPD